MFSDLELSPIIKYNRYFSDKTLKSQIKNLLNFYSDRGYPFSTIEAQNFLLDDKNHTISYQLKITEGSKVIISQIQFSGNQTKKYRLKQISGLKSNTYYSDLTINKGLQRIKKHNISTKSYNVISLDTTYILQINVDERKFQEITGAITFLPNEKELNGFFYFNLNNLFYTLRKINLSWQHYARFTNFTLNYTDPWLMGFIINSHFTHNVYDTFYTKTNFDLNVAIPVLDYLSINFLTGYENINSGLTNLENYAALWLGQGFKVESDNRSNIVYYLDFNTRFRTRKLKQDQLLVKTDLQNKLLIPLKNYTSLSLDWHFKNLYYKTELPLSDSLYIGGIRTLRGYRESEFATNRYLLTRNELIFLTNQSTNFFTFSDIALIREPDQYQLKLGYGIGLRAISKIGTIALDYGIPQKDNLLNGKIHLSFTNQF